MSGIYISGMEPPKPDEVICIYNNGEARKCPLFKQKVTEVSMAIPVPEHGRLIDANALTWQMERNLWAIEDKAEKELGFDETLRRGMQYGHAVCVDAVNDAPTIIPADGKDTNVPTREEGEDNDDETMAFTRLED